MPAAARRKIPSLAASVLAGLSLAAAACMPGAPAPPKAPVRGQIALADPEASRGSAAAPGPLRVVFASPEGDTTQASEVTLVFSRPMRPLGLGPHDPPPPVMLRPEVPGRWQWVGSSALRFNAAAPMPDATAFTVFVPAGTRALDGTALDEAFSFSFNTPRPALSATEPEAGADSVPPDAAIRVWFTQRVAPEEVARAISLRASAPLPFRVEALPDGGFKLLPAAPLPRDSEVKIRVDASLRALSGDLPAGKDAVVAFKTVGPLSMASFSCQSHPTDKGACDPETDFLSLAFSNPIPTGAVAKAITIDPPIDIETSEDDYGDASARYTIVGEFEPGRQYRVRVRAAARGRRLADMYGQALPADVVQSFRFGDRMPEVNFRASGTYWPGALGKKRLPVRVMNALDVSVHAAPLSGAEVLARLASPLRPAGAAPAGGGGVSLPSGPRNESKTTWVKLDTLLPAAMKGPVLLSASYGAEGKTGRDVEEREFQLTDLGVITRAARDGAAVWVTQIETGQPIAGAGVELYRVVRGEAPPAAPIARGTTDPGGLAALSFQLARASRDGRLAIVVRRGDDWAYQTLGEPRSAEGVGVIFDERGIYRPGETVKIKGVFRVPATRGLMTPRGRKVAVRIVAPGGAEVASWKATLSAFGTFSSDLPLREDAPLGRYTMYADFDDSMQQSEGPGHRYRRHAAYDAFEVADYRPAESTTEASTDRAEYVRGDSMKCTVAGKYLYGAPMAGATATVVVTRGWGGYTVPGLHDYVTYDQDARSTRAEIARGSAALDDRGELRLPASLALPGQRATETVTCRVEIADLNRRVQSADASATVHAGEVYVALRRHDSWSVHPGDSIVPEVLVVDPRGARRALPVHVEILKRSRSESGAVTDTVVDACDVTTGAAPVRCAFTLPRGTPAEDDEIVVRGSTQDARGNPVAASYSLQFEPPPPPPAKPPPVQPSPPSSPPPPRLEVEAPDELRVGDTARITVRSPFPQAASALLTLEREGILTRRLIALPPLGKAPAVVEIPVTRAMIPNVIASVVAVSGSESERDSAYISIDPASRELAVTIGVPSTSGPGDVIDVDVAVKDAKGAPARAEVTLWAADEGSLMLTNYRRPLPEHAMFKERSSLVVGADARDELVHILWGSHRARAPKVRMGATSVSGRRGDFRQTVFYAPDLVTDASGKVRRRVKLPDGLTTYRFMAIAVANDDRFGSSAAKVVTSKSLMARPTLPRVIRAGDRFDASVVVSTKDLPPADVSIAAAVKGLVALGPARQILHLQPDRPAEVRFPFRADRAGPVRLAFDAAAPAVSAAAGDGVDLAREVVAPMIPEVASIHGDTRDAIAERLADLAGVRRDAGGLSVSLSATPLAGLAAGVDQLIEYPYGCTEQTVSRMVPLLGLRDLARALGAKLPSDLPAALSTAAARVVANQRGDGGFGLWPESGESSPWVTAYALWGLGEATRRGVAVRPGVLDRARAYLARDLVAVAPDGTATDEQLATAAFVVDVLAAAGAPDTARTEALFERRARLPLFAKALLLHAIAKGRPKPEPIRELTRELEAAVRIDGPYARAVTEISTHSDRFAPLLDSEARTSAMVLYALVAAKTDHPLAGPLALGLLADRRGGTWRTTHETAWALLALDAYRRAQPLPSGEFNARVFLGPKLLGDASFKPADLGRRENVSVPMARLLGDAGEPLTFAVEGAGRLFYEADLRYVRKKMPADPIEAGFFVQKTMRPIAAPGIGTQRFTAGQVVLCEIEVVTPSPRQFVVIDDPLPGGFEVVDFALRTGGSWMANLEQSPASRRELRDDRVLYFIDALPAGISRYRYLARAAIPGSFQVPPTRAEEMYVPETFGRTAAATIEIAAP